MPIPRKQIPKKLNDDASVGDLVEATLLRLIDRPTLKGKVIERSDLGGETWWKVRGRVNNKWSITMWLTKEWVE